MAVLQMVERKLILKVKSDMSSCHLDVRLIRYNKCCGYLCDQSIMLSLLGNSKAETLVLDGFVRKGRKAE